MKIRNKLLVSFIFVIVLPILFITIFNYSLLQVRMSREKIKTYEALAKQTLTTFDFMSKDIEYNLFTRYSSSNIPGILTENSPISRKQTQLEVQLRMICINSPYISSLYVQDLNGNTYFGDDNAKNHIPERISQLIRQEYFPTEEDIVWLRDGSGILYLKRNINSIFPLRFNGILIATIESNYLQSVVGLDYQLEGCMAILDSNMHLVLSGKTIETGILQSAAATLNSQTPTISEFSRDGVDYLVITARDSSRSWSVINLVPMKDMVSTANSIRDINIFSGLCATLIAIILSVFISRTLTRNINKLVVSMEQVSKGNLDVAIDISSKDEIGKLTSNFRWMLLRLKEITLQIAEEATRAQQAKYEVLELKYRSLQAQISPHFICNILSAINSFSILKDTRNVETLSILAGSYLRRNLNNNDKKFVTVKEEISSIKGYVRLYRTVFAMHFTFIVQMEEAIEKLQMPNMILQPLVENALSHGAKDIGKKKFRIEVNLYIRESRLIIEVKDNGCGIDQQVINELRTLAIDSNITRKYSGFGTGSVSQRLMLLYPNNYDFSIISKPNTGSTIIINIPAEYAEKIITTDL